MGSNPTIPTRSSAGKAERSLTFRTDEYPNLYWAVAQLARARVSKTLGCGIVPHLPRHRREQQHLFKYELDCKSETHKQDAPSLFMER